MTEHERPKALNRELRAALVRRETKHRDLAAAIKLRPPQLSERLNGSIPWRLDHLFAAADFLGVPLSDLIAAAERAASDAPAAVSA